jgi:glutathionylspermidine synthase
MRRRTISPRAGWQSRVEKIGLTYHTANGVPYWDESVCYEFSAREVDELEAATNTLQELFMQAGEKIIREKWLAKLAIPKEYHGWVVNSWERDDPSVYGRFDLSYDGASPPKLLEYNADTPTSLLEASVAQWYWLEDVCPEKDQFNSIHERLIARWKEIAGGQTVYFSCINNSDEDLRTIEYLTNTAVQAGVDARGLFVEDIGWNGRAFVDLQTRPIGRIFKLYPWEWLVHERFGQNLLRDTSAWIEPPWKMLWSNKALLAILWEMFPGHPNLAAAYFSPEKLGTQYVKKPILSREGANVTYRSGSQVIETPGDYGEDGYVYQALCPLPCHDGNYAVIGSWIVHGEAAGMGIREDTQPITGNLSRFVPHYFVP